MDVDLELYRVFCEVVKYKNISRAAESMYHSLQLLNLFKNLKIFSEENCFLEVSKE